MFIVHVLLDRPASQWQLACLRELESVPGPTVCPGPVPGTDGPHPESGGLTVDLRANPEPGAWRVVCGNGRSLAAPDLFSDTFGRAGRLSAILIVDGQNEIRRRAVLSSVGRGLTRLRTSGRRLSAAMLAAALSDHMVGLTGTGERAPPPSAPPAGLAGAASRFGAWAAYGAGRLHQATHTDFWHLGIIDAPIARLLASPGPNSVRWLRLPAGTAYRADPFGHPLRDDEVWCERYDYRAPVGVLERLRLNGDRLEPAGDLPAPVHRSFPFMAVVDGTAVAIPEASAGGQTTMYRLDASGGLGEPLAVLPVPGIDPVVFRWRDRLWLALTRADLDNRANLCLWHAPALSGPWTAHTGNPVKLDVRSARGGGTPFEHDGALYRPAQDCSRTYGGAVTINRVIELTPTTFSEAVATVIRPAPDWPAPHGVHTLSAWGDRTLIDAKRESLSLTAAAARIGTRLWRPRGGPQGVDAPGKAVLPQHP
jgi:hypothetical protein